MNVLVPLPEVSPELLPAPEPVALAEPPVTGRLQLTGPNALHVVRLTSLADCAAVIYSQRKIIRNFLA